MSNGGARPSEKGWSGRALAYVERWGAPKREGLVWAAVIALAAVTLGLRAAGFHGTAGMIFLVGIAAWIPLFLQAGNKRTYGAGLWMSLLGAAAVANVAFAAWGPLGGTTDLSLQL